MRSEQPTKLLSTVAEDEGEGWVPVKPVQIPGNYYCRPKAVLSLRFHLFDVRCCSIFFCFKCVTLLCAQFI